MTIPSLNALEQISKEEENQEQEETGPTEAFTYDDLMREWHAYTQQAIQGNKMNLVTIMKNRELELNGSQIVLTLDNSVQVSALSEYKEALMQHLRSKLNNYSLVLDTKIQINNEKRLYTSQDKFEHLIEDHPALLELKNRLGLELDF